MKFIEFAKNLSILDIMILNLDEKGFSADEIASVLDISRQTVFNCKKRNTGLMEAVKKIPSLPTEYGNPDINLVVNTFSQAFGTTKTTKFDRWAAKRLIEKHTAKAIVNVIAALAASAGEKYAPTINNISQLETKLPQVIKFLQGKSNERVIEL